MLRALLTTILAVGVGLVPTVTFADPGTRPAIVFPLVAPRLSSDFGVRRHPIFRTVRHHSGVDLQAPQNSHVRTVAAGRVIFAGKHGSYGKLVTILHDGGYTSLYGHLSEFRVNVGATVSAGEIVGRVGSSGAATGPHLHFEWRLNGEALDPLNVFPSLTGQAEG